MAFADADTTDMAVTYGNPHALDSRLIVRFQMEPLEDAAQSKAAGRPVYVDTLCVYIKTPGAMDYILRKATKSDKLRFPRHLAAFEAGQAEVVSGFPLKEWIPNIGKADVENLGFLGIRTVEQLAAVPDGNLARIGNNATSLKQKAIAWLERTKSDAPTKQLEAKNKELENKLEVAIRAIEVLQKQQGLAPVPIVEAAPSAPRKRSRKPKQEVTP